MSLGSLRHSALKNVPPEVIYHILDSLETRDLLRCTLVNKYLWGVVNTSSSLLYKIQLSFARYSDAQTHGRNYPSVSKRLALLRQREQNWKSLKWTHRTPVPIGLNGSIYEFIGGVYGYGKDEERLVNGDLSFFALPVKSPGDGEILPLQQWSHTMPESNNVLDFSIDPSQDLLILVGNAPPENTYSYEIHLYSLSTFKPHYLAPDPILYSVLREDMATFSDENGPIRVQVSGDYLAFLVKDFILDGGARLQIWNWKVGSRYSCSVSRTQQIDDFIILSRDEILIVSPDGTFEVCQFSDPSQESGRVTAKASFALPRPISGYRYWYISLAANPSHGYIPETHTPSNCTMLKRYFSENPKAAGSTHCPHCQSYQPNPSERILSCCLYIWKPEDHELNAGRVYSFLFFTPLKVFLNYPHFQKASEPSKPIPWKAWGPENTRWFHGDVTADWNHGVYGCRALDATISKSPLVNHPLEATTDGAPNLNDPLQTGETLDDMINAPPIAMRNLRLRDFNPHAVAQTLVSGNNPGSKSEVKTRVVTETSVLSGLGVLGDITSSLPYVEVVTEETFEITDVMLDEARILLMKRTLDGQLRGLEVLTM